ncbi:MAG: hypothetical protein A2X94_10225 [Bdellovibrionales bacterium GWB1_55_8]|nr:MAG: hypothetical protein A2X94_10225 [Bdellovibrionales bacterium GWB1_55_8]
MGLRRILQSLRWQWIILLLIAPIAVESSVETNALTPKEHALKKIKEAGISDSLVAALEQAYLPEQRDRIVELNVLGFLSKGDYSGHYSKRAVQKCREFIARYQRKLKQVEARSGVPKEVIAALLWVETKHGTQTGRYPVANVYFSLLQADHPEVMKATLSALRNRAPASVTEHRQKVIDRSIAKSNWALTELKSLSEIHRKNPRSVSMLFGSYAGAFGIPQFIPSSYLQWARPNQSKGGADLFKMEDAIQSVAFYLKSNGWKPVDVPSQTDALFHYNRAQGYVEVILKIAQCTRHGQRGC